MTVYIHEQSLDDGEYSDYSRALGFIGEEAAVQRCVTYLSSCVLGAVAAGELESTKAVSICETLVDEPPSVFRKDTPDFMRVVEDEGQFSYHRIDAVVAAAAAGKLTTVQMREELAVANHRDEIGWLSHEGRTADIEDDQLTVRILDSDDIRENFGEESPEFQVAQEMGLTHFVWQHDLVKPADDDWGARHHLRTEWEHVTLGTINADGEFNDVITVLHTGHPARQGLTPEYDS